MREHTGRRYSGAVLRVEIGGRVRFERAYGVTRTGAAALPIDVDTRFDIASLTKLFVATAALEAVAAGRLDLAMPLTAQMPQWRDTAHAPVTAAMLLAHSAGFRSGADYRTLLGSDVERFAASEPLVGRPGEQVVYSDLGFIVLGTILSRAGGIALGPLVGGMARRLGAASTNYRPHPDERPRIAATESDAWRGCVQGFVHDEKAYLMNGVAGHAGLFAAAAGVARMGEWYLAARRGRPTPLDPGLARLATHEAAFDPVLRRGLGWALRTTVENSCGALMSADAFGHTGFTGTSIWLDPQRDCSVVLLTNAVHFGRSDLREIRAAVGDAVVRAVDA